ncbi:MAG: hypothetical protein HY231_00415 [Acidobacteria bacterium]|nr:hypothetical protein [Acidobacteriota bacterium]
MSASTLEQVLEKVKELTAEEQEKVRELLAAFSIESKPKMTIAEVEQKMVDDGLLTYIPLARDLTSYKKRRRIQVKGKPLSETIIEERR